MSKYFRQFKIKSPNRKSKTLNKQSEIKILKKAWD